MEVTLIFNYKKKLNKEIYFEGCLRDGHLKFKALIVLLLNLFHCKIWPLILFQKTSSFVLLRSSLMDDDIVHTLASDTSWHCPGEFYTNNFTKVYYVSYHPPMGAWVWQPSISDYNIQLELNQDTGCDVFYLKIHFGALAEGL